MEADISETQLAMLSKRAKKIKINYNHISDRVTNWFQQTILKILVYLYYE